MSFGATLLIRPILHRIKVAFTLANKNPIFDSVLRIATDHFRPQPSHIMSPFLIANLNVMDQLRDLADSHSSIGRYIQYIIGDLRELPDNESIGFVQDSVFTLNTVMYMDGSREIMRTHQHDYVDSANQFGKYLQQASVLIYLGDDQLDKLSERTQIVLRATTWAMVQFRKRHSGGAYTILGWLSLAFDHDIEVSNLFRGGLLQHVTDDNAAKDAELRLKKTVRATCSARLRRAVAATPADGFFQKDFLEQHLNAVWDSGDIPILSAIKRYVRIVNKQSPELSVKEMIEFPDNLFKAVFTGDSLQFNYKAVVQLLNEAVRS